MNRERVFMGLVWRFMERIGAQFVTLIVSIVLARLLDPEVYGTIALVAVFTSILNVFVDSGLGKALIQKKDADEIDFSTVFYFNIVICLFLYGIMFFLAPVIADFYNEPELTSVIRVLSLVLIITGVKNVQHAYVARHMLFKRFFFATLGGTIGAGVLGIWLAYNGYGIWALVAQNLFNVLVDTLVLWITVKWRPLRKFSWKRLKALFSYGWKLLASSLLDNLYNEGRQLAIGKLYSSSDLAFYNRGKQFPDLIVTNVNTSIDTVLFPVMSSAQDDKDRIKSMTRRSIRVSSYIMIPMMVGLACVAEPFIGLLLGEKWLSCVPFLQIICIAEIFEPIHTANLNAIKALGRSDLFLKMDVLKRALGVVLLLCTLWHSVLAMTYSWLLSAVICSIINAYPNRKLLNYFYFEQLKDIFPAAFLSVLMAIPVCCVRFLQLSYLPTLIIQIAIGVVVYLTGSLLTKNESLRYIYHVALDLIKGRKKQINE